MRLRLADAVVGVPVVLAAATLAGYAAGRAGAGVDRARLAAAERAAHTDRLTGLPNRAAYDVELARRSRRGERYALLLADLDGFKSVNDRFGHAAGDAVLAAVGGRLARLAGVGGFAARLGGDEFVLIAAAGAARRLAAAVCQAIAAPVTVAGTEVSVGASVGVAYAGPGVAAGEVLYQADVAMYQAKDRARAGLPSVVEHSGTDGCAGGRSGVRLRDLRRLLDPVGPVGAGRGVAR
jgi:diguanylate cyclase (GGDEF)-like protein